jgi:hypothetical protein
MAALPTLALSRTRIAFAEIRSSRLATVTRAFAALRLTGRPARVSFRGSIAPLRERFPLGSGTAIFRSLFTARLGEIPLWALGPGSGFAVIAAKPPNPDLPGRFFAPSGLPPRGGFGPFGRENGLRSSLMWKLPFGAGN